MLAKDQLSKNTSGYCHVIGQFKDRPDCLVSYAACSAKQPPIKMEDYIKLFYWLSVERILVYANPYLFTYANELQTSQKMHSTPQVSCNLFASCLQATLQKV